MPNNLSKLVVSLKILTYENKNLKDPLNSSQQFVQIILAEVWSFVNQLSLILSWKEARKDINWKEAMLVT